MKLPWVSREMYEAALARCDRAEQLVQVTEARYRDMIEKFSAQLTGMVKEGYRTPPPAPPIEAPYAMPSMIRDAIFEVAGDDGTLTRLLEQYAFHNKHRPVKAVADEIRKGS